MLTFLDWLIIIVYLLFMIGLSVFLSRGQKNNEDYYLGGNDLSSWSVALSTMATQCSTNSLLGAPAFVAFSVGGGLLWLQYEIALPIAMIGLILFMLPLFRALKIISVYNYLEQRFNYTTRLSLSLLFQFLRAFSTGVTVYGISLVLMVCLDIPFWAAAIGLGVVTVIYDTFGGMKAVVLSDVIQMVLLVCAVFLAIFFAINLIGGWGELFNYAPKDRLVAIDFSSHGLGDGKDFAFWPMLFGGLFLYMSYYGTDQSQVQRELSTKSIDDTNQSLFLNGLLRFPLVISYCFLGICLAAYAIKNPEFIQSLPLNDSQEPNYNLAVPMFVLQQFPAGLVGLVMVGLFAAAMSSLDSVINSLSAVSLRDVVQRVFVKDMTVEKEVIWSRALTVFWGVLCVGFAFYVENIADSIIVAVNKIGSLTNGSILGVFLLGLLTKRGNSTGAIVGMILGVLFNLVLWIWFPMVSWLWWNVTGFLITFGGGYVISRITAAHKKSLEGLVWRRGLLADLGCKVNWASRSYILAGYFLVVVAVCYWVGIA
jgi:SSS family transporter